MSICISRQGELLKSQNCLPPLLRLLLPLHVEVSMLFWPRGTCPLCTVSGPTLLPRSVPPEGDRLPWLCVLFLLPGKSSSSLSALTLLQDTACGEVSSLAGMQLLPSTVDLSYARSCGKLGSRVCLLEGRNHILFSFVFPGKCGWMDGLLHCTGQRNDNQHSS